MLAGWTISSGLGVSRSYETHRDLLTSVSNIWNGMSIGSFIYANDVLARQVKRVDNASVTNDFCYNLRSEVTSAAMGTNQYGYVYDPIGNRISDTSNSVTHSYTANALNQYTQITNGGVRTLAYDLDGNLTNDSVFTYTWDAENRLTQVSSFQCQVSNRYDFMSRRVEKAVNGVTNRFVYDGWNLVTETSSTGVTNVYVWGMDLSGSLQCAGGIGGLVSVNCKGTNYFPCYDSNGNITDYVDTNGTVVAHREYNAFGNTTVATGTLVHDLHFWFSTKYLDEETNLYYYGYRYLSAELGRWQNRDPLQERVGVDLYVFCANESVGRLDVLGQRVIVSPQNAVGEVVELFNILSDLPSWAEGNEIKSCCTSRQWVPRYPACYNCLCTAIDSATTYTVLVFGSNPPTPTPLYYAPGMTGPSSVQGPLKIPRTSEDFHTVEIPSASAMNTFLFGAFNPSGQPFLYPRWRLLAHELCGHAVSQMGTGYEPPGDRASHNPTILIENQIAAEHGGGARGLYANPKQGESFWMSTPGNNDIYYRNLPFVTFTTPPRPGTFDPPSQSRRPADYRRVFP